jgi:hypothetical protein
VAQRVVDQQIHEQIEWCLDYLWDRWSSIPWWVENWPGMDGIDKEVFCLEWTGITEHWLGELQRWEERGLLTLEQRKRYTRLSRLIAEQRPALEALLGVDAA